MSPDPATPLLPTGKLTLATRRSPLALAQAREAAAWLQKHWPGAEVSLQEVVTTGDRRQEWSLKERGGKGLFTKELEEAVLRGEALAAVHSAKDLPTQLPEGLVLAGFLPRADVRDVLVIREDVVFPPEVVASSSPRRQAQGRKLFPRAQWREIRGNVQTRLEKLARGEADAMILAKAGLDRLGITAWPGLRFEVLGVDVMVPAAGQAAIGLECRPEWAEALETASDAATAGAVLCERYLLEALGGGCHVATAVYCSGRELHVFHETWGRKDYILPEIPLGNRPFSEALEMTLEDIARELGNSW